MLRLLRYIAKIGTATKRSAFPPLADGVRGLPKLENVPCRDGCSACEQVCPTAAVITEDGKARIDLGACIACGMCVEVCPSGTIINDSSCSTARTARESLIISSEPVPLAPKLDHGRSIFSRSLAVRVVSTGCTACDLELAATGNAIFDMERFGVQIVASPRYADALVVTGPVPKAMHEPLIRCYESMPEPRIVIAVGTCAISGGVHKGGYTEANGVAAVLPVDVFVPGCPPHPSSIIQGIALAMNQATGK